MFRRREKHARQAGRAPAKAEQAPSTPASPTPEPGDRPRDQLLGVAGRLHAFNRYELKYLVPVESVDSIRDELAERMDRDPHAPAGGYGVWSVYYDTAQLRFYWEKIEGLKFRRKLRIRHYGDLTDIDGDSPVQVEIKQRVNRVTQKRRIQLPYDTALRLCDRRESIDHGPGERAFVHEVLDLVNRLDLRPTAITGYQREALIGRAEDTGLRVTFDRRVRGRDRDFHLGMPAENRYTVPPRLAVMEIKVNERTPYWITDITARRNLQLVRISKYVQSIEAFGLAPRSVFHVHDPEDASPVRTAADAGVSAKSSATPAAPATSGTPGAPADPDTPVNPDSPAQLALEA